MWWEVSASAMGKPSTTRLSPWARTGWLLHYRKVHLFAEEKVAFRAGNLGFPVVPTRFGNIGVCVCSDLRFVEVVRLMALRGADLICVPTAWLPGFDNERWDEHGMCPQANGAVLQANLSQVYIACASQAGLHGELRLSRSRRRLGLRGVRTPIVVVGDQVLTDGVLAWRLGATFLHLVIEEEEEEEEEEERRRRRSPAGSDARHRPGLDRAALPSAGVMTILLTPNLYVSTPPTGRWRHRAAAPVSCRNVAPSRS